MIRLAFFAVCLLVVVVLTGCATTPIFETREINLDLTPELAIKENDTLLNTQVLWGGFVLNATNLKETTQIEVLAYPLDSQQQPNIQMNPYGRFLVMYKGYLELADYTQGRLITVSGHLGKTRQGKIGEATYVYPFLSADKIHLWPEDNGEPKTRFQFGLGVVF